MEELKFLHEMAAETEVLAYGSTAAIGGRMTDTGGGKYYCRSVFLDVPVGNGADDLFLKGTAVTITSHTKGWTALEARESRRVGEATGYVELGLQYRGGKALLTEPVQFTLTGKVNNASGTAGIVFTDEYSPAEEEAWEEEESIHEFTKGPVPFYLKNLMTAKPDAPTVPCCDFSPGQPIRFSWEGSGTSYKIYKKGEAGPIYTGRDTFYEYGAGVVNDTTFILEADLSGNDRTEGEEKKLAYKVLYDTITVTVKDPTLHKLTVEGNLRAMSRLSVGGYMSSATGAVLNGSNVIKNAELNGIVSAANGIIHMMNNAARLPLEPWSPPTTVYFTTDGILYGLFDAGYESDTAYGEISAIPDDGPYGWDITYYAKLMGVDGQPFYIPKAANIVLPVSADSGWLLMQHGEKLGKDYAFNWWFVPFGAGKVQNGGLFTLTQEMGEWQKREIDKFNRRLRERGRSLPVTE